MDKWAHLGHTLGECWYSKHVTFVHIPKNASSFVKGCLINNGWQHSNTFVPSNHYLVVLRDPLERWLSGMAEYQVNSNQLDLDAHTIFNTITFDDHTELQTYFLKDVNITKTTFLLFGDNLRNDLNTFLLAYGFNNGVTGIENINASDTTKQAIKNRLQQFMDVYPEYKIKVQRHFVADYHLYENSIYGTRQFNQ
jgi:hypothetical protein